jgi:hypothetical protein
MKTYKCTACNNKTFQKDSVCALCRIGLTEMYDELVNLLQKDSKHNLRIPRAAKSR